jgi:acyl-CoA thioesterase-1
VVARNHLLRSRPVVFGLVAALVALTVGVTAGFGWAHARGAARCEQFAADSTKRTSEVTGSGQRVVVIGDSWSAGLHLAHPVQSWPSRLAGRIHVYGFSGSGFSEHASACGQVSYADRAPAAVAHGADLVVVEGGLNDFNQSDAAIRSGFDRLMATLSPYRVVIVGPASAPSRMAQVPRVNRDLRLLAKQYGVAYIATRSWKLPYLDDRLHLTAAGHREFGDLVQQAIAARSAG